MSNKYYIYVRGIWRELCTESGRVCGAKVKFLCMREGTLRVAPRSAVLRGLKALAAGQLSPVRDGPHLSFQRRWSGKPEKRPSGGAQCSSCSHLCSCCKQNYAKSSHVQNNNVDESKANIRSVVKADASTQVAQTIQNNKTIPTRNTFQTQHNRNVSESSDSVFQPTKLNIHNNAKNKQSPSAAKSAGQRRRYINTSSEEDILITSCAKKANTKTTRTLSSTSEEIDRKKKLPSSSLNTVESSFEKDAEKRTKIKQMQKRKRLKSVSSDSEVSLPRQLSKRLSPRKAVQASSSKSLTRNNVKANTVSNQAESDICLELDIDETEVELIRRFLSKVKFLKGFDANRYDTDEEYKRHIFYKLHPCVNIERRNLSMQSHEDKMSLEDFVTKLGLQKVGATVTEKKRYPMRKRFVEVSSSASETNKENERCVSRRVLKKLKSNQELPSFIISSESDNEALKKVSPRVMNVKSYSPTKKVIKRGVCREYSELEDAAIVRWVSGGEKRERLVNGNRVWQQLEDNYTSLTGQLRSWHSLRNRYLRHILPSLGARGLQPALVARLRAAAHTGEIKSKFRNRENSIFRAPPVASAWAKRPNSGHRQPITKDNAGHPSAGDEAIARKRSLRSSGVNNNDSNTSEQQQQQQQQQHGPAARAHVTRQHSTPERGAAAVEKGNKRRRLYNPH